MAKSLLEDRTLIPSFHLPARDDMSFDSLEYKRKKNLVIFFVSDPAADFLVQLEEALSAIREQNGELVVVSSLALGEIEKIHQKNRLTYWILSDPAKEVFSKFIQAAKAEEIKALFITDRFAEVFFQYLAQGQEELPPAQEIIQSLNFIESQCPECGGGL